MGQIDGVQINKFELKLADTDDPVAQKVGWSPVKPGGANFRTHKLNATPMKIAVERTKASLAFASVFAALGGVVLGIGLWPSPDGDLVGRLIPTVVGAAFLAVGIAMLVARNMLTFDKARGVYFHGDKYAPRFPINRKQQGSLSDIHALQLIREVVSTSKGGAFTSYELNLVFKDGERLNVMDHGDGAAIEESAKALAAFLGVPVWQAVY